MPCAMPCKSLADSDGSATALPAVHVAHGALLPELRNYTNAAHADLEGCWARRGASFMRQHAAGLHQNAW